MGLQACDVLTLRGWLPTFRRIVVASSSTVSQSKKAALGLLDPEDGGTLIIETAGTGYPKTRRQTVTGVRYIGQV